MRQIIQNLKTGKTILEEIPVPVIQPGYVLIKTHCSVVSTGTEKMIVEFSKANLIKKARQQPERVKEVLDKIKTDGLMPTLEAIFRKLDEPLPLGYCNAGEVVEVGEGVSEFKVGDRVASNGNHAEFVCVPKNLVARIPEKVSYSEACFAPLGAIALQGIRNIQPEVGETVVVIGLGLIGILTCFLLKANGCHVVAIDVAPEKISFARQHHIQAFYNSEENIVKSYIRNLTTADGADAVIITATATGDEVISQSARLCRKKGKIVLVGVVGLQLNRNDFYKKELSFSVSSSYGPGRYDEAYESKGIDYPISNVRWTAKRNFEAVLQLIENESIDVTPLMSSKTSFENYEHIYNDLNNPLAFAHLLEYKGASQIDRVVQVTEDNKITRGHYIIGIIGAGNYTQGMMLPVLKKCHAQIKYIASSQGMHAKDLAKKNHIPFATSDYRVILEDKDIAAVVITTQHNLHAQLVQESLLAGKHTFVEKPLAIEEKDLDNIIKTYQSVQGDKKDGGVNCMLMVGFNRRFSPYTEQLKKVVGSSVNMNIIITVNAGYIPPDSWVHDIEKGGGRVLGEACHFIDLAAYIAGSGIRQVHASHLGSQYNTSVDNVMINLKMENGTQASIHYLSNGSRRYPKEKIEVFAEGKIICIDNFRSLKGYGHKFLSPLFRKQDKGHLQMMQKFMQSMLKGTNECIPFHEIVNSTRATFAVVKSLQENRQITL